MKVTIFALAVVALAGGSPARACNPLLAHNFGKRVAPTTLPAAMLAKNNPITPLQTGIVGLWHDVHTASDGTLFLEGYDTWNRDGTELELANLPPATGPICVGVWKHAGKNIRLVAHVTWLYDLNNDFVGTLDMTQENTVDPNGNLYTGTFDAKFFDPMGTLMHEVKGTTAAERLAQ